MIAYVPPPEGHFVLKEGSGVFVSVARACDFFPLQLIQDLKLVPFVYKGLEPLEPGHTTHLHQEAESDLQNCQVFVVVMPLSARGRIGNLVWGYAELDLLTRAGMKGFLYLPLVESIPVSHDLAIEFILPPYAVVRNAPNCERLSEMLREDLRSLMASP
jgi:hypothetical protein